MAKTLAKTVDELTVMDDLFFTKLAEDEGFCEEILQTILEKPDLRVIKVTPQKSLRNIKGRSVCIDVECVDAEGIYYNIEIQKENDDDHQRRVRYNGSNLDTNIAEKGILFCELPEVYVVYISKFDVFEKNKTIYHIDRILRETGDVVDNGFHEVYVNTKVNDGTDIAELMKIFKNPNPGDHPKFQRVCNRIRYFKEEGSGRESMCRAVEEYAEEKAKEVKEKLELAEKARNEAEARNKEQEKALDEAEAKNKEQAQEIEELKKKIKELEQQK